MALVFRLEVAAIVTIILGVALVLYALVFLSMNVEG